MRKYAANFKGTAYLAENDKEYCLLYTSNLWGPGTGLPDFERMSDKEFAAFARIAPQRRIITTDLGQVGMPHPVDGMRRCILAVSYTHLRRRFSMESPVWNVTRTS